MLMNARMAAGCTGVALNMMAMTAVAGWIKGSGCPVLPARNFSSQDEKSVFRQVFTSLRWGIQSYKPS